MGRPLIAHGSPMGYPLLYDNSPYTGRMWFTYDYMELVLE